VRRDDGGRVAAFFCCRCNARPYPSVSLWFCVWRRWRTPCLPHCLGRNGSLCWLKHLAERRVPLNRQNYRRTRTLRRLPSSVLDAATLGKTASIPPIRRFSTVLPSTAPFDLLPPAASSARRATLEPRYAVPAAPAHSWAVAAAGAVLTLRCWTRHAPCQLFSGRFLQARFGVAAQALIRFRPSGRACLTVRCWCMTLARFIPGRVPRRVRYGVVDIRLHLLSVPACPAGVVPLRCRH